MNLEGKFLIFRVMLLNFYEKVDVSLDLASRFEKHVLGKLSIVRLSDLLKQIGVLLRIFEHEVEPGNGENFGLDLVDLSLLLLLFLFFQFFHNLIVVHAALSSSNNKLVNFDNILALD